MPGFVPIGVQDLVYRRQPGLCEIDLDSRLHRFRVAGVPFVLDVASGTVALLDETAWDVLPYALAGRAVPPDVAGRHGRRAVAEAIEEIGALARDGLFSSKDPGDSLAEALPGPADHAVKALCLHVAESCNMSCAYCFASGSARRTGGADPPADPSPRGAGPLMSKSVARSAVDFLFRNSGQRRRVEIDFFGGEPLLNFDVVREATEYATRLADLNGKTLGLTITTNAALITPDICEFLNRYRVNAVLSIDGRPAVHDAARRFLSGAPSYEACARGAMLLASSRAGITEPYTYVRGTYTHHNLDFLQDVLHIVDSGFESVSMEPVVCAEGHPWAIRAEDIPALCEEYERLAVEYVRRKRRGRPFRFFHFEIDLSGGPCLSRRLSGCGAGRDYLAVAADGTLYPCHQFVGAEGFAIGDVENGVTDSALRDEFSRAGVKSKAVCRGCWARYMCGGGCHAGAYYVNGSIHRPHKIGCELQKKRLECAMYAQAVG
ncbi:MAG: thioether cross-link-forming SCIFF peptide maturase [Firmicutes bacterium]|jgi:uncharacterized protein|nr:thioether cross-link-forming SCIFF peptide maturase [Bacillota bacterium]